MTLHHVHKRREHVSIEAAPVMEGSISEEAQIEIRQNGAVAQAFSTVYVYYTESATFTGATAALSTQTANSVATTARQATSTSAKANSILVASSTTQSQQATSIKSSSSVNVILPGSSTVPSTLAIAVAPSTTASASASRTSSSATQSSSSAAAASATSTSINNGGMSTGGKVGIAVGVVLGLGALISLLIFCFRRKRKQAAAERLEDEKSFVGVGPVSGISRSASTRSTKTGSTAPRLNLRPVTQFSPNLDAQNANAIAMTPINEKTETKSAWERPSTSASQDVHNPFGNHAEIQQAGAPVVATGPGGPHSITPYAAPVAAAGLAAGAGAVATAANAQNNNTIGLARGASKRENRPQQLDLTKPTPEMPTPSNVPGSAGSAAIVAAGGPQNSTVHRVQLDFKPSMEDELELKAGQLIRKLMEYDDGWCLCIRLDRSEQGVVPRTCLSSLPVKPRPQSPRPGPPPSNGYRGGPPRPGSAQSNRSNRGSPPLRPGSAQSIRSNRGPQPPYNRQPPRPGSAQSHRPYAPPHAPFASQPRPSSANSNHTIWPGQQQPAPSTQHPRNYNPNLSPVVAASNAGFNGNVVNSHIPEQDRQFYQNQREGGRAESPAPLRVPDRNGEGGVERKPVPGMAL